MRLINFYLRVTAALQILFVICALALSALGSTQPIHPALRGFVEGCEGKQPLCWYGIALVDTDDHDYLDFEAANQQIQSVGYSLVNTEESELFRHYYYRADGMCDMRITDAEEWSVSVELSNCPDFRLGDLLLITGEPDYLYVLGGGVSFYYPDGFMFVTLQTTNWVSFASRVERIEMLSTLGAGGDSFVWRGLLPHWRYCEFHPGFYSC